MGGQRHPATLCPGRIRTGNSASPPAGGAQHLLGGRGNFVRTCGVAGDADPQVTSADVHIAYLGTHDQRTGDQPLPQGQTCRQRGSSAGRCRGDGPRRRAADRECGGSRCFFGESSRTGSGPTGQGRCPWRDGDHQVDGTPYPSGSRGGTRRFRGDYGRVTPPEDGGDDRDRTGRGRPGRLVTRTAHRGEQSADPARGASGTGRIRRRLGAHRSPFGPGSTRLQSAADPAARALWSEISVHSSGSSSAG
ncbi:hypothetical protein SAMN04487820_103363 [Actinopolyspora mzabensis]|uniref:Uncharacterized protein n=1 Tax=Actinopolyspora mzabensis TaxID=995066 RepID=A0A1G8YD33_ACTMZ|nr:hypothetical protein SAMN04487820_103363 [Actinopolyspora mzabensis]